MLNVPLCVPADPEQPKARPTGISYVCSGCSGSFGGGSRIARHLTGARSQGHCHHLVLPHPLIDPEHPEQARETRALHSFCVFRPRLRDSERVISEVTAGGSPGASLLQVIRICRGTTMVESIHQPCGGSFSPCPGNKFRVHIPMSMK
jgi:hypothetical protein